MELEEVLKKIVKFEYGLISYLSELQIQACEAPIHIYVAEYQDPATLCGDWEKSRRVDSKSRQTAGAGLVREEAIWAAIGESIERYSASNWMHLDSIVSDGCELPGAREFLEKTIFFSEKDYADAKFKFSKPDATKKRRWLKGVKVLTNEPYYIPLVSACMNVYVTEKQENLDRGYSTGLASHNSVNNALYSGICEVVERDGFASYWLTKSIPKTLSDTILAEILPAKLFSALKRIGDDFRVFALQTDLNIPILACCVKLSDGGIAIGASSNIDVSISATKAVVESLHGYNWCLDLKRTGRTIENKHDINDFSDHVSYYLNKHASDNFLWWSEEPEILEELPSEWVHNSGNVETKLSILVSQLDVKGFVPVWVDITSPDIRDLGFNVIKAFVPGLQPLSAGYYSPHTDCRRLKQFANYLGINWNGVVTFDPPHAFP